MMGWTILFLSWFMSAVATLGSLFFSEVMKFPPCVLCWYQRICMYPLVLVLFMGLFPYEKKVARFALPLAIVGWFIALYHNLLYYHILPESAAPCVQGISCTTVQIQWFGFVTIPFMSFVAFSFIVVSLLLLKRISHEK
ncbi:disulfide oxidoreductase [Peredibacter starrii]|uniref:Disulfide oxidoreductase n=1 Tax=Peredibacter starrii TaxID=28202 RepID=A0AAX4HU80_9BACT|nr:disulfide oxidoreductase [Peredibacter starrii]WPU66869.1 disulfide oxidoreductase [Peredibacter starrii]